MDELDEIDEISDYDDDLPESDEKYSIVDSLDELGVSIEPDMNDTEKNEIEFVYDWFKNSNTRFIYIGNGKCVYEYTDKQLKFHIERAKGSNSINRLYKIVNIDGEMSYKNLFIKLVNKFLGLVNDPEKLMLKLDYYVSTVINETSVIVQAAGIINQPDKTINREIIIKEIASMLLELMHPTNYLISVGTILDYMLLNFHKHCFICGLFHKKNIPRANLVLLCDSHICAMENEGY